MPPPAPAALPAETNPLFEPSTLPYQAPQFDRIKDSDFEPAIEEGMKRQLAEIEAIADDPAPPTFEKTIVAMEKTGQRDMNNPVWSADTMRQLLYPHQRRKMPDPNQ